MLLDLLVEIGLMGGQRNIFRRHFVVLGNHFESGNHGLHRFGGFQQETVCRDDSCLGEQRIFLCVQHGMQVGNERRVFLLAHQDHHICRLGSQLQQMLHFIEHFRRQILLLTVRHGMETDVTAFFLLALVELLQFLRREAFAVDTLHQLVIGGPDDMVEEGEVEPHYLLAAAEIAGQRGLVDLLARQALHDMPVAVSPAVDGLLDIAHDEEGVAFARQQILQQLAYDAPLQAAGVLELVHQHVVVADACFLQDEIRVSFAQGFAERACRPRQQGAVRIRQIALDQGLERTHQLHIAAETDGQLERVIAVRKVFRQLGRPNGVLHHLRRQFSPFAGFGVRQLRLRQSAETVFRRDLLRCFERLEQARAGTIYIFHMRQRFRTHSTHGDQPFGMNAIQYCLQFVPPLVLQPHLFYRFAPACYRRGIKQDLSVGIEHLYRFAVHLFRHGAEALPHIPLALLIQFQAHVILQYCPVRRTHLGRQQLIYRRADHMIYIQLGVQARTHAQHTG